MHAPHERQEERHDREQDGEQPEVVRVGQHLGLAHHVVVEHGHRAALRGERVGALGQEVARPPGQPLLGRGIPDRDVAHQVVLVELAALGQIRGGERDAHAAPEVAQDVVGRRRVDELVPPDGGQGQGGQRHEDEAEREALDDARQGQAPVVHAEREVRHHVEADRVDQAAEGEEQALVHAGHQAPAQDEREHVAEAAGGEHEARGQGVVAEQLLGIEREQHHAREHAEADQGDEAGPEGEVAVGEHPQVQDGILRRQLADEEADEGHARDHREHDDQRGVEPVLALPAVQHELETAEAQHHQDEAGPVHPARLPEIRRIEEEGTGHEEAEQPDRQVDVEDPAPRPVVRDVAAQGRPDDRPHHEADAPHRHREAALAEREDLPQDGLGERDDRAAPDPLRDAREDQEGEVRRHARQHRAHREQHAADQEEALAAQDPREPAGGGNDDGVGGQVGGDDPRHLLEPRGERALQVRAAPRWSRWCRAPA